MLNNLLECLLMGYKSGEILYEKSNNIFNSNIEHHFVTIIKDSKVEIVVKLNSDNSLNINYSSCVIIHNKNLGSGIKIYYVRDSKFVGDILNYVYTSAILPTLKTVITEDEALSSILGNLPNKATIRDIKLDSILDTNQEKTKEIRTTEVKTKRKSIIDKILGN